MSCAQCKDGLIPLVKNGRVVPYSWVHCACYEELYTPHSVNPEDIDFPISYGFYRSLCRQHGWADPGPCEPPKHESVKPVFRPRPVDYELDQLRAKVQHIERRLNNHTAPKKKVGIRIE